jgi:hypothetical protein
MRRFGADPTAAMANRLIAPHVRGGLRFRIQKSPLRDTARPRGHAVPQPISPSPEDGLASHEAEISTNLLLFGNGNDALRQHYVDLRKALGMSSVTFFGQIAGASLRTPTAKSQVVAGYTICQSRV